MSELWARMTLKTYRMVGSIVYPFMGPFLMIRARKGKEDRSRRHERYGYPSASRPEGPIVWFHAASVGESIAVIPLIEKIHEQGINTIMTTGTVTSAEVVRDRLPANAFHQYVPLDVKRAVERFLDHWQPDLAVFTESEIWPMTILEMNARRIPQVLVNARMSDRSFKRWVGAPKLAKTLFTIFSHVVAQSELDAERFQRLGAHPVSISGNLKVDTHSLPYDEKQLADMRQGLQGRPVWVAASTHAGEEEIVASVHKRLKQKFGNLLTIIVPRHPERADDVGKLLSSQGLKTVRRSSGQSIDAETDVFLGDTIGEMGLYLRLGNVCFVGRSLVSKGGQNPLEPAGTQTAIISGRHVHNFRDAYRNLLKNGGARLVGDEKMLAANVAYLLENDKERELLIENAARTVKEMGGALEKTAHLLEEHVFPLKVKRVLDGLSQQ